MNARLFCRVGELAGAEFPIGAEAKIGKSPGNDIVLSPGIISGSHARIYYDNDQSCYFIEDLNSRNGTRLDGIKVAEKEKLGNLDVLTFADSYDFIFQVLTKPIQPRAQAPAPVEEEPAPPAQPSSRTIMDRDVPMVPPAMGGQPGASRTMANTDFPQVPNIQPGQPGSSRTMAASDMPMVPNLQPGQPGSSRTMADTDLPMMPNLQPGQQQTASKTMAASDMPQVPQMQAPPAGKTVHQQDVMQVPQLKVPQPAPPPPGGYLYRLITEKDKKVYDLKEGENLVGRAKDAPLFIDHSTVSRKHALITIRSGKVTVKDLGSSNHTFVDDKRIDSEVEITPYSKVKFGAVEVRLITQQMFNSGQLG